MKQQKKLMFGLLQPVSSHRRSGKSGSGQSGSGQSFVELAILFPILLILISGMVEFGFLMNQYLALIDSARNSARFSSDSDFSARDSVNDNCDPNAGEVTGDFFLQTACVALQELAQEQPNITLDFDDGDDIVISAFTVVGGGTPHITARHPAENGWSYAERMTGTRNQFSEITSTEVASRLQAGSPNTGLLVVEIYYHYDHLLNLPWITAFLDNPLRLHSFSFMPLVSAEPTSTPPAGGH